MTDSSGATNKVYQAGGTSYSMLDILRLAFQPEFMAEGMPRITDFHMKVGEPIRFRMDGELQAVQGASMAAALSYS